MATISASILSSTTHLHHRLSSSSYKPHLPISLKSNPTRLLCVAEETPATVVAVDPTSEAARRLYVGNIPRTTTNDELLKVFQEHGSIENAEVMYDKYSGRSRRFGFVTMKTVDDVNAAIEKLDGTVMYDKYSGRSRRFGFVTMKTVDDVNAAIEKLDGTEIGGRKIKVNVTEKPLNGASSTLLPSEETPFVDSPYKLYVGNLAKTVTSESLKSFFADKGNVLGAKVSRVPGTSKSSGFGFVSFSSEEEVEAAISSFNDAVLEGQKIRVNKA